MKINAMKHLSQLNVYDWLVNQFDKDEEIKRAMGVVESVHVDEETDEALQDAVYDIISRTAEIAAEMLVA